MKKSAPYALLIVPGILALMSKLSPINIYAQTFLFFVPLFLCVEQPDEETERHEATHVWQQLECAVVGTLIAAPFWFLVWPLGLALTLLAWAPYGYVFWIIYLVHYVWNLASGMSGPDAYENIIFEHEAYAHDGDSDYLATRPWFAWVRE